MKMKKLLAASLAAALTLSAFSVSADEKDDQWAEDHPNKAKIMVKARIKDACYLGSVPMLDFGKLFPGWMDAGFKHMIDGDLTFKCTKGTHYTLSFDQGKNAEGQYRFMKRLDTSDEEAEAYGEGMLRIPYWLINGSNDVADTDADELGNGEYGNTHWGYGLGLSSVDTLNIIATLYEDDLADVVPGNYKDTVTVTLSF